MAGRISKLAAQVTAPATTDTMAEAGRKVLLADCVQMLKHEKGSRLGSDPEEVHDMRVAIRRMRSTLRLLKPYFRAKVVRRFAQDLRTAATALGAVRDLDVLLGQLRPFAATLEGDAQSALNAVVAGIEAQWDTARVNLVAYLDSKAYRQLVKEWSAYLTAGDWSSESTALEPLQVRYLLPSLIYDCLADVRAYESIIEQADAPTLHQLRITCKRLRYAVALFEGLLGSSAKDFIRALKLLQDDLGALQDSVVARELLADFPPEAVAPYFAHLDAQVTQHRAALTEHWAAFQTRKLRQKLANALLALN